MTDLKAAEKRARAARDNAYAELCKTIVKAVTPSLKTVTVDVLMPPQKEMEGPGVAKIMLAMSPAQLHDMVAQMQQRISQLDNSVSALCDLLLENRLVAYEPDPRAKADEQAPPLLKESTITVESYFLKCAKNAEATTDLLKRMIASQTPQERPRILRPS